MNLNLIKRLLEAKNENTELDKKSSEKSDDTPNFKKGGKKVVDPAKDKPVPTKKDGLEKADSERESDGSLKAELPPGGKALSGEPANKVDMEPTTVSKINEAKSSLAVVTFGRMNPPTVGHEMLVDQLCAIAKKHNGTPLVFLSRTQDKKKNPIPYLKKLQFARRAFGSVVQPTPKDASSVFGILKHLEGTYSDVILVVGSDRVAELQSKVKKYNGIEFKFNHIEVQSAGERDPDEGDVAGASASKLRQYVKDGKVPNFVEGLPEKLRAIGQQVYQSVRIEEGLEERMIMNQSQLFEQAELATHRIEADYELSEGEVRALHDKADETGFPVDVIESCYKRGVRSWELTETILDHQQFAFNRVHAMLNGGSILDDDLFEGFTGDIELPLQDAQPNPADQKQMHRTKVKPGKIKTLEVFRKILEQLREDSVPGIKDGKGVRRVDMPQINDFDAFTKDLEANGTPMREPKGYKPTALTPLQKHFNQDKVDLMKNQKEHKPIIISSDNKIIDGHHRWMAAKQGGSEVHARMVGMRHADLMTFLKDKPYVGSKKLNEDVYAFARRHKEEAKNFDPDSKEHHIHMATHHELIGEWHRINGRDRASDASMARANLHHEAVRSRSQ